MTHLSSVLDQIKNLGQQEIQDLIGKKNLTILNKLYEDKLFRVFALTESSNVLECELELTTVLNKKTNGSKTMQKFTFQLTYLTKRTVVKCSCGKRWKPGTKLCLHVGCLYYLLLLNLPLNVSVDHQPEARLSELDYRAVKEQTAEKLQNIESLDIEPAVVLPILKEIRTYLHQLLLLGLQRTSNINVDYLANLIIKAHLAKLANIERQLQSLQETIHAFLLKEDLPLQEFLLKVTRMYNYLELTDHLLKKKKHSYLLPIDIIGTLRSDYIPVPDFEAFCIGANGWVTDSGFIGATLYYITSFQNLNNKSMLNTQDAPISTHKTLHSSISESNSSIITVSNVRPLQYVHSINPSSIFNLYTPTGLSLADIAYNKIILKNPKINHKNQLSLNQDLLIIATDPVKSDHPLIRSLVYTDWLDIVEELRSSAIVPIELSSSDKYVILEPKSYGSFVFNAITGSWIADVVDQTDHRISIYLQDKEVNYHSINNLQTLFDNNKLPNAVFGKIDLVNGRICVYPYTLYYYQGYKLEKKNYRYENKTRTTFHLYFDNATDISLLV